MIFDIMSVVGLMLLGVALFALAVIAILIVSCAVSVGWTVGRNAVTGAALQRSAQKRT